jgi:hypothetical protein
MSFIVVSGASELILLAHCLTEDNALFKQEQVQFLRLVIVSLHSQGLLHQQFSLGRDVALQINSSHQHINLRNSKFIRDISNY